MIISRNNYLTCEKLYSFKTVFKQIKIKMIHQSLVCFFHIFSN